MARTKGTPNKRTDEFRQILHSIRFDIPREAAKLYPTLGPSMQFKMLEFLAQYCYPKLFAKVVEDEEVPQPMAESTEALLAMAEPQKAIEDQHCKTIQVEKVKVCAGQSDCT